MFIQIECAECSFTSTSLRATAEHLREMNHGAATVKVGKKTILDLRRTR